MNEAIIVAIYMIPVALGLLLLFLIIRILWNFGTWLKK